MNERVIYLKSFSKIMFPGLRIGLAIIPTALIYSFQHYKNTSDIDSSMISQAALELYLKSGMFGRYRAQVMEAYAARAKVLKNSITKHLPMYETSTEICMHSHLVLPKQLNMTSLILHLKEQHVWLDTTDRNYLDGIYRERIVKINVSNVEEYHRGWD